MALYKVLIKVSAGKELAAFGPKAYRQRLVAKMQSLASSPRTRGSEKLGGYDNRYRVRHGNYRIV